MNRNATTLAGLGDTSDLVRSTMASPVGELTLIASPRGLRAVLWPGEFDRFESVTHADDSTADAKEVLAAAIGQLEEYFAGERHDFDRY